jgi:type VI secretion system protein ImpA
METLATNQPNLLDFEEILRPISDSSTVGNNPRLDVTPQSLYFRLRDARSEARAAERIIDNDPGAEVGASRHWIAVRDLAIEALITTAKDIEIAAWLTESLVRSDGLAGLQAGSQVLSGLVSRYWDDGLFPLPDEDGIEGRVAPIAGLNGQGGEGTLLQPLRKLVLYERADGTPVTYWQFEQAEEAETLDAARKAQRIASGTLALPDLEAEAQTIGRTRLTEILRSVIAVSNAWRSLDEVLVAAAQEAAPPTRRVHEFLEKLRRTLERYAPMPAEAPHQPEPVPTQAAIGHAPVSTPVVANHSPTREDMLQEISRLAAQFRIAEPHSPLSYTLDDAVRRARLGLPELLKEMMPDLQARSAILSGLGIKPPSD